MAFRKCDDLHGEPGEAAAQIIEVSVSGVRSAVITLRRPATPIRGLLDRYGHQPRAAEWLTIFDF